MPNNVGDKGHHNASSAVQPSTTDQLVDAIYQTSDGVAADLAAERTADEIATVRTQAVNAYTSTDVLRSALERINEALYVDENTGEWRLPAAFDANFIDAALSGNPHASDCALHNEPALPAGECDCGVSGSPAPSTEGLRELASEARFLLNRLSELSFDDMDDHAHDFDGHVEPSISRLSKILDDIEARTALAGVTAPVEEQ